MNEDLGELQRRLGHTFNNVDFLIEALTHPSCRAVDPRTPDYDRMEFLGDAVLGLIVSRYFYDDLSLTAGDLTKRTSSVVNRDACERVGDAIELAQFIRVGPAAKIEGTAIQTDCVEALIAAVYLDGGYDAAESFVLRHFSEMFSTAVTGRVENPKAALNELCLKRWKQTPSYEVTHSTGPDHAPTYTVNALFDGRIIGSGSGGSKREAENRAAEVAIETLQSEI